MSNQAARPVAWSVRHVSGKYGFVTLDRDEAIKWASVRNDVSIHALGPIALAAPINYGSLDPVQRLAVCRGEQVAVVLPERLTPAELEELEVIEALIHGQGLSNLAGTMAAARQFIDEVTRLNTK